MKTNSILWVVFCLLLLGFRATATTHYVDLNSTNPTPPYLSWDTASTNIQPAINVANNGDLVLVTNGIYQAGTVLSVDPSNQISSTILSVIQIGSGRTVSSVNGPTFTVIKGRVGLSCAFLMSNAVLSGFTLTNGRANNHFFGAGAYCLSTNAYIANCLICNNNTADGGGAGAYLGTLSNCVISNNVSNGNGGGTFGSVLSNCTLIANSAYNGGGAYGGIGGPYQQTAVPVNYPSRLNNCILVKNSAVINGGGFGGGAFGVLINNSLITSNYAYLGSGGYSNIMNNCVVAYNDNSAGQTAAYRCHLTNCTYCYNMGYQSEIGCSFRNCILVSGNTTLHGFFGLDMKSCYIAPPASSPMFVNVTKDFHLQSNSPCINAGNNLFVTATQDLDGNPRIVVGTVDMGAYEYQTPSSVLSYAWAQQYGLPTDGSADNADADGDGMSNYAEFIAGTNPTNAASLLQLALPVFTNTPTGMAVTWQSVSGITYYLQRSSDLTGGFSAIQSNLVGQSVSTTYTDTSATKGLPYFYRVGVQ